MATRIPVYLDFENGIIREVTDGDTLRMDFLQSAKLYSYTADGTEGDSFTIAGIAGFTIMGIFRAGMFKRVQNTATTSSEVVKISGTNATYGVTATGDIELQSGDALVAGEKLDFLYI